MKVIVKYVPFFYAAILLLTLVYVLYPYYQYYVDPDGTAYLTISKRYAKGDYWRAINGYWSPWSCWLTAILIKAGLQAIPASVIVNVAGAVGFLGISQTLFLRFSLSRFAQMSMGLSLSIFATYVVYFQSFDDIWECFFLLSCLYLMLVRGFPQKPLLWVLLGIFGAFAYFSKAYAFPFFIMQTLLCMWLLLKQNWPRIILISAVSIAIMLLCASPWLMLLHHKYGFFTTSTAGKLNMSWYLVGHPYYKNYAGGFLPPIYSDSPYFWEDPWYTNAFTPHFYDSWALAFRQVLRIGLNTYKFFRSSVELSLFAPFVLFAIARIVLQKAKVVRLHKDASLLVASMFLFPLGYWIINFESRYLWFMVPLLLIIGYCVLAQYAVQKAVYLRLMLVFFSFSFTIFPVFTLLSNLNVGKTEYEIAQYIKHKRYGPFTAKVLDNKQTQRIARIAYFSGCPYWHFSGLKAMDSHEIVKSRISYLFTFDKQLPLNSFNLVDSIRDVYIYIPAQ